MDILEGNKLIGTTLFGAEYIDDDPIAYPGGYYWQPNKFDEDFDLPYSAWDWEFHSDWNWLMNVVDKIGKLENFIYPDGMFKYLVKFNIEIGNNSVEIYGTYEELGDKSIPHIEVYKGVLIENIWIACVEFIEWYNKQKESN